MRAVVVGASSGLGRCIGVGLAQRGANVALLARRRDNLEDAAKQAGNGTAAIARANASVRSSRRRSRRETVTERGAGACTRGRGVPLILPATSARSWSTC